MNKTMKILLAAMAASFGGMMQARAETGAASATVEFALDRICADGSSVDGRFELGYAATENQNAVLKINDERLMNITSSGHWPWSAPTAGVYTVSHAVGDNVLSATYVVTNGYAKVSEEPNPPMNEVDGITLSTTNVSVAAAGEKLRITISGNGESWTGATSVAWISLWSTSGTAAGKKLVCEVAENVAAESRVGYVYVAGQIVTVTQAGRGATLDRTSVSAATDGSEETIAVTTEDAATTWEAWTECPWILVETSQGTGSGEVVLKLAPWNNASPRTGTVTIAGQVVTVTQEVVTVGYPTATAAKVGVAGDAGSFAIETTAGVTWSATSDADWLVVEDDSQSKRGGGTVSWTAQSQTTLKERVATITVAPAAESGLASWSFTVTQEAAASALSATSADVSANQEKVSVEVDVADGISWEIENVSSWIALEGAVERTGAGTVALTVAANPSNVVRTTMLKIASKDFTVTQAAAEFACPSTAEVTVGAEAGTNKFEIAATDGISWKVKSDADWLTILSDESLTVCTDDSVLGRGKRTVSWTVQSQPSFADRTATITVTPAEGSGFEPWTLAVTQTAAAWTCPPETNATVGADASSGELAIETGSGISWTATSDADWLTVADAGTARAGSGVVSWTAQSQTTLGEARTATITVKTDEACGDKTWTFTVTQDAAKIEIEGGLTRICPVEGADLTITVRVDVASATWAVAISEDAAGDWVFMKSGDETLTGDAMFDLYVAEADEGTTLPRTATVTIGNLELVITQKPAGVVITPADGGASLEIPDEWFEKYYPNASASERQAIAEGASVKTDASGAAMPVWHDYVAGTDPTNALSKFTAKIEMKDGAPVVTWSPALNGDGVREGSRVYRVWGKANLGDAAWCEVGAGGEADYRFFRVTVEMP